jgi:cytochrome c5
MSVRLASIGCAVILAAAAGCSREESAQTPGEAAAEAEPLLDAAGRTLDPATGLVLADGYELVASNCIACHSAQQFLRQRGTRATWQRILDWMQATQGLWEFPEGVEERIVDYLATHSPPRASGGERRSLRT